MRNIFLILLWMLSLAFAIFYTYEHPEKIQSVYTRLERGGEQFKSASRRVALGSSALALSVEHTPIGFLKPVRNRIRAAREQFRDTILYRQPDVQGGPWHDQNGKALALGTIVDAHDLQVVGDDESGVFSSMSGRLGGSLLEYRFPHDGVSENLAGKSLTQATFDTKKEFRGDRSVASAERIARGDLKEIEEFMEAPVLSGFKDIVAYCTDSLGIRSRKEEVRAEINRYVDASEKESFLMMSVGCGTALPMLEVMQDVVAKGRNAKMILIDQDAIALAAAGELARQMGLEDNIEVHCSQLFVKKEGKLAMMDLQTVLQGRELDVCEDSGLREYFPDAMYRDLTSQAWGALGKGGLMTTGNMNKNRPQADFLHGLMGWPLKVRMRHIKDIARLHAQAGIPKESSRLRVTQDGVYTLCFSTK